MLISFQVHIYTVVIVTMESEVQVTGVLAPPCIHVNLYPKGFVCIDVLYGITGIAANPVSDQTFSTE